MCCCRRRTAAVLPQRPAGRQGSRGHVRGTDRRRNLPAALRYVSRDRHIETDGLEAGRTEPRIGAAKRKEAANHQPRSNQKRQRDRKLRDHERASEPAVLATSGRSTGRSKRVGEASPCGLHRRHAPEDQPGRDGRSHRKDQNLPADRRMDVTNAARRELEHGRQRPCRKQQTTRPAHDSRARRSR